MSEKNLTKIVDDDKKNTYTLSSLLNLLNSGDILKKSRIISDPSISLMARNSTFGGKTSNGTDHPFSSVYNVSKTNNSTNSVHSDFVRDGKQSVCSDFNKFSTNSTCSDYGNFSRFTQDSNTCSRQDQEVVDGPVYNDSNYTNSVTTNTNIFFGFAVRK